MGAMRMAARLGLAAVVAAISTAGHAALLARDFDGAAGVDGYYDTVLGITWLRDANLARTSNYDGDGRMTWSAAKTWAAQLDINGFSGWRLAGTAVPDPACVDPPSGTGANCTGGELGYMFYINMGGQTGTDIAATHNANYDLFVNLQSSLYWANRDYPLDLDARDLAYFIYEAGDATAPNAAGLISLDFKTNEHYAWAVRDGDIGASDIPEPGGLALLGAGLFALRLRRRMVHG